MAENTVTMEIIDSEQYKRANIRFNGKPSEEIREELKKEGWFYSRNHNVWYPKNDAAANSRTGNEISWTAVSADKSKAVSMTMQILTHPNAQWCVLMPLGLDPDVKYHLQGRDLKFDLREFGGLVNYVAPIHVKQDGFLHKVIAKFYKMNSEKEEHTMYGDAMMYAGVHLRSAFASGGYNENMRYYPDFGSRIYTIEKVS